MNTSVDLDEQLEGDSTAPQLAALDLEQKYKDQMRQIVTQKIDLPISTLPELLKNQIKLNPEFQRRDRWDEQRQSRLIESLIMNVPIPPVFLGEDDYGHYVVLDGRQRLTAISRFLGNDLRLSGLQVWSELNGASYSDLVKRDLAKFLTRRFVPGTVILRESSPVVKYDVFDRLNTGGVTANAMEIRNAIYRGGFTEKLHVWSRVPAFCRLWRIPVDHVDAEQNKTYKEMQDLELILRFFALREFERMDTGFSAYLTEFLSDRNKEYSGDPGKVGADTLVFTNAVENAWRIFGEAAFVKPSSQKKSIPFADAVLVSLSDYHPDMFDQQKDARIVTAFRDLLLDKDFLGAISSGTNGRGAIARRVSVAREAVRTIVMG
jgi:hypothetical protein